MLADGAIKIRSSDVIPGSKVDPTLVQQVSTTGPHVFPAQGYMKADAKIDALKNKSSDAITGSIVDPKVVQYISVAGSFIFSPLRRSSSSSLAPRSIMIQWVAGKKKSPQKGPDPRSDFERLRSNLKELLDFSDDRSAKVSLIMTAIKKNMDSALPPDLPPDLLHEVKLCLGNHSSLLKASFEGVASMAATRVQKERIVDPSNAQEYDANHDLLETHLGDISTCVLGEPLVVSTLPRDEDVSHGVADQDPNRDAHLLDARDILKGRSYYNQNLIDHGEGPHPLTNLVQPDAFSNDELQQQVVEDPENVDIQEQERAARYHLDNLLKAEECTHKQHSSDLAINLGDSN
ncbi:hypothetical protein MRB53_030571 [Persea americana]|uniref:Uncharacterized protein n=2 Tax=Persea americana TaxID=3435 RepID=A0ACC2KM04_PERAE|nr:hypothetical protein MRB53_030564 [Persea americana]KAJ8622042.1 hypothetical protein MRB53_030571 [Persea americana]